MTFGIFNEIERLIEYIPLDTNASNNVANNNSNARFAKDVSIDSQFRFHDIDGIAVRLGIIDASKGITTVSFRDIIRLLNKFLRNATIEELVVSKNRYKHLQNAKGSSGLPLKNLLFDFCLLALEAGQQELEQQQEDKEGASYKNKNDNKNLFDAKLYLAHCLHLLGLHNRLGLILSVIINEPLLRMDKDVRRFLTLLAMIAEPHNVDSYFDSNVGYYNNRYSLYLKEMQNLTPVHLCNKRSMRLQQEKKTSI